jgi:hypothetical protein
MTRNLWASPIGPAFDPFLYASIGEDPNGTPLSLLSALARMDIDPWGEAQSLAKMPPGAATDRLAALIAASPEDPNAVAGARRVALQLVALLPRKTAPSLPSADAASRALSSESSGFGLGFSAILFALAMILLVWTNTTPVPERPDGVAASPKTSAPRPPPVKPSPTP